MRIVLVSPFTAERGALHQLLVDDDYEVAAVATREEALDLAAQAPPDVVIADARVAGVDGLEIVGALEQRGLQPRVILLCPRACRPLQHPRVVCLTKPIELAQLRRHLADENGVENRVA